MESIGIDVLIIFDNGVRKTISNVSDYGFMAPGNIFWTYKNSRKSYYPNDQVLYFGSKADYDETKTTENYYDPESDMYRLGGN